MWRLGLENQVFYLPDVYSPKILEVSMVLRFRIILNVMVRIKVRILILTLIPIQALSIYFTKAFRAFIFDNLYDPVRFRKNFLFRIFSYRNSNI